MRWGNLEKLLCIKIALAIAFLLIISFAIAFPTMFSTFASYDDEGYVMMTLRTYMDGHRLYGDTYTQYGPAYYLLTAPVHSVIGLPLSHDAVRMKSIVVWLLVASCSWFLLHRFSRSIIYATAISLLVAIQLRKLSLEPGHPQELALLGTMGVAVCMAFLPRGLDKLTSCIVASVFGGFFASITGWTKLNCGIVASIPLLACTATFTYSMLTGVGSRGIARAVRTAISVFVVVPGLAIAWSGRSDFYEVTWALSGALAALVFVRKYASKSFRELSVPSSVLPASRSRLSCITPTLAAISSAMICSSIIIGIVLSQGVSPSELWYGVVGQHQNFSSQFFQPIRPQSWLVRESFLAAISLSLAVYYTKSYEDREGLKLWLVILTCITLCGCSMVSLFSPLSHGLEPLASGHLLAIAGPWLILYLFNFYEQTDSRGRFGLGLLGIMAPWIAFPVAGTQIELGTIPTLIAIGIGFGIGVILSVSIVGAMNGRFLGE